MLPSDRGGLNAGELNMLAGGLSFARARKQFGVLSALAGGAAVVFAASVARLTIPLIDR